MRFRATVVLWVGLTAQGWFSDVRADETLYRTWHRKGAQALEKRLYRGALEAFKAAVSADPSQPDGYFNVGSVAMHLKRCRDVLLYFQGFLYLSPGTDDDKVAKKAIKDCEKGAKRVLVRSEPPGAEVIVAGVLVGRTPLTDLTLTVGDYPFEFRHPDCEVRQETIAVRGDEPIEVTGLLELKPAFGYLEVVTIPAEGVTVWVDDREVGVTPLQRIMLPVGKVLVRLEKPGYDRWIRSVRIQKDAAYRLDARLEENPAEMPVQETGP